MKVRLNDAFSVSHIQLIHSGTRCPIKEDDVNRDSELDIDEIFAASGRPLFPLDDDPGRRHFGKDKFPYGSYLYEQTTSYQLLLSDLQHGETSDGLFVRLEAGADLDLNHKIIMIYGTRSRGGNRLGGFPHFTRASSVPIACGVFQQISHAMEIQYDPNFSRLLPRVPTHPGPRPPTPVPTPAPEPRKPSWFCRLTRFC